ncbi:MAG: S26 family signal peptidase [Marinifilaceae bacterium]|jgi:signal peptidase I|nr:S26 family signal peptidase [Marinifilaceae bacterium]
MIKTIKNKWFKYSLATFTYFLMTLWIGNFWLLLGLPIVFDVYISKKVHWAFWKKKGVKKQTKVVEWIDAVIFAVVAATIIRMFFIEAYTIPTSSMEKSLLVGDYLFVSKVAYGPKMPNTPLSFPFVHHTMPGTTTTKSYSELIQWPYKRLAGFGKVKRNDVVVFNFPAGDTIIVGRENPDYYMQLMRKQYADKRMDIMNGNKLLSDEEYNTNARNFFKKNFEIRYRPVDKRENYIKRCVGVPGDTLTSINGDLYINKEAQIQISEKQYNYMIATNGNRINPRILDKMGIAKDDILSDGSHYQLPLTDKNLTRLNNMKSISSVVKQIKSKGQLEDVFPFIPELRWNRDNFGPLYVPQKGATVNINIGNLNFYRKIIEVYEANKLRIEGENIYINDTLSTSYTFKMNYYWMMGDNRHMSSDSRYWGFVPEDHIVGKGSFVWLSLDKDKSFPSNIRWSRILKAIN